MTPQPKRRRVRPIPRNPFAPWSYRQIQQEADRRLAAVMDPQRTEIQRRTQADTQTLQAAAQAAAAILREQAPAVQQAYDLAAKEQAGAAQGFTAEMAAKIKAAQDAAAQFAKSQGAPDSAPAVDTGAFQNVNYELGGYLPSSALSSQGAAARAAAEAQPGILARAMEQDVRQRLGQSEQELLDLAAKRPEVRAQILDELNKYELDKAAARIQQRQAALQERAQRLYERQFGETVRSHRASERIDQLTAAERARHNREQEAAALQRNAIAEQRAELAAAGLQLKSEKQAADAAYRRRQGKRIDAAASRAAGHLVDRNGDSIYDRKGRRIPVKTSQKSGSSGFPTR